MISIFVWSLKFAEISHPCTDFITFQLFDRGKKICPIFTKLRVAKSQELIVTISDRDAIAQGLVDTGKYLVIAGFIGT